MSGQAIEQECLNFERKKKREKEEEEEKERKKERKKEKKKNGRAKSGVALCLCRFKSTHGYPLSFLLSFLHISNEQLGIFARHKRNGAEHHGVAAGYLCCATTL